MKGTFYAVSVGPGDPELMTLQAVKLLERISVLAVPVSGNGTRTAYDIAAGAVELSEKEIISLQTAMVKDKKALEQVHKEQAEQIRPYLDAGKDVAMLSLGDVSVYSTAMYLLDILEQEGYSVKMLAGVPSFCAAAAELGISLTKMEDPIHIIPAPYADVEEALKLPGTKILMKSGKSLPGVVQILRKNAEEKIQKKETGTEEMQRCYLAANVGMANQYLCSDITEIKEMPGYFTTIIVK